MTNPKDILNFWFADLNDEVMIDRKQNPARQWFAKDEAFDQTIKARFEGEIAAADRGERQDWCHSAQGMLATIILFDQFTRNIYRNNPKAYAFDAKALGLTQEGQDKGLDDQLPLIYRTFFYMPLMHAEDIAVQRKSVEAFSGLVEESKSKCPHNTSYYVYTLGFAQQHQQTIQRYGRFPQRAR